jgi:DNA polymerase elongation subunit (family B)
MVVFQALTWEARDVDNEHLITILGRTQDDKSVAVTTPFKPYFFVKMKKGVSELDAKTLFGKIPKAINYEFVKSKDLWGFQNSETFLFMKLNFNTLADMKFCDRKLSKPLGDDSMPLRVYESNIDPLLRFMHRTGVSSTGWLEVTQCIRSHLCKVDTDLFCNDWKSLKPVIRDNNAPFRVASFDIETHSSTGKFPDPNIPGDCVFQIALTLKRLGETECYDKTCLCYKQTSPLEGCNIISYETERELLVGFSEYLFKHDIDVITGWNIFGFDLEYIYTRAVICGCVEEFSSLGKIKEMKTKMVYKKLSSNALGDNMLKMLPMSGRYIFDLFQEIKREQKLDSYSLNHVSKVFLEDQKIDMSPHEMFARFREGDPDKLAEVAEYCIKDTILPHRIMDKLCNLLNLFEMAKATWVPLCFLSERGQQIKVFSQLARKSRDIGFMIPTIRWGATGGLTDEGYEGATVLDAHTGAYYTPITALDFEGLYPSIMMAHNLCYSSLVLDPKYGNIPGVKYEEFTIGTKTYKFAQDVPSLLPEILSELKQFRKQAKRDMAAAEGDLKKVYNGKQLAYKVSMNSVYGFTGASKGILPCVAIASTVTCEGRHMIEQTKEYVEENFPGAVVRYGDSVTPDTPLVIRQNGVVKTCRIDSLVLEYQIRTDGKETSALDGVEVWTEKGFTRIEQVVRHRTAKKMYRVLTHTGVVDCTEDHSLLLSDATEISPENVTLKTELLHGESVLALGYEDDSISPREAKVMGFFYGDGSCGTYDCPTGEKSVWTLNNANMDYLMEMQALCPFQTTIYDTMESSGVYKMCANGHVKNIVTRYRKMFYNKHKEKIVPSCILNAPLDVVQSFVDGYYMADGDKGPEGCTRMDNKGKEGTAGLFLLCRRLGYNVSLNTRGDKPSVFRLTCTRATQRRNPTAIKKIVYMGETDDYVYDLTTASHHFAVAPGELVVHNTDSVMVEFDMQGRTGEEALEYSWKLGEQAAEECNSLFKKPKNLELEKVYWPYILYSKKRYAAKLWTQNREGKMKMDYIDVKGLQVVRRDNTLFVRNTCKELLDVILESKNSEGATKLARSKAVNLLAGDVPMEDLILSQKLADQYKTTNLPHVQVRDKMREREPGSEPQSGDRVQFVLVKVDKKDPKQFEMAEDPVWVKNNNLVLDYNYYFTNKFMNPICDLLEPLVESPKDVIFGDLIPKKPRAKRKSETITNLFKNFEQSNSK